MRADLRQASGTAPDLSQLVGRWVNVHPRTDYIERLSVAESDGGLVLRVYGAGDSGPVDWGEVAATPYVAGGRLEAGGFHACFEPGPVKTWLAANQKLGILVIQTYTSFADGSGRLPHFSREFFRRED
jgi:hypothetical protein